MLTAGEVMDASAALLNDTAKTIFTYEKQIPYLNIALGELREVLNANNISLTNETEAGFVVTAGTTEIEQADLPCDLVEIQQLQERAYGSDDNYSPMRRVEFLPATVVPINFLIYWAYQNNNIKFLGSSSDREVKINYIANRLPAVEDEYSTIDFVNAQSFLQYRNAALCAQFIGENKERSDDLNAMAQLSHDRMLSTHIKAKQAIATRHKPFLSSYKNRNFWY